jgi:hypothetical protein
VLTTEIKDKEGVAVTRLTPIWAKPLAAWSAKLGWLGGEAGARLEAGLIVRGGVEVGTI